ncbi:FAD-binding oxidoreductase [Nocardia sp. CDC160]|uniref:FAD-binding oxidoreductase n=1 Tax=Nocardia sp. CDC160 TaxID=3112166 RepID=UPI002DBD4FB9|nr:FAD-binding oxidoreductase [Nocardia sp. CDC160]MEC3918398.1 FAD-binding oxidoreductase [Nocardia sp. CDC160]MEC3919135.1 FAD-binding oxidoreductase [Nocardia sp. CDC160]
MSLPGDPGFEAASRPWSNAVTQQVRAAVELADADDAAALVRYARRAGASLSVQPNGHGASDDLEGIILVRTSKLDTIQVDPAARTARVGAGVAWGRVLAEAGPHGLTGLAGSSAAVNVTGFCLGGGLSWFGRKHGWAADSVTAFDIVDADGHPGRITATSDPDLFWALRGGGGDFALVTAIELDLHPAPAVFGGQMVWPGTTAPAVMTAFRDVTAHAPDELTVWFQQFQPPGSTTTLTSVLVAYLGDETTGRALLSGFDSIPGRLQDTRRMMAIADLGEIASEPTDPSPERFASELLTDIDDHTADALLQPITPLLAMEIRHLGGAFAQPSDSAAGPLTAPYCLIEIGMVTTPESKTAIEARRQQYRDALRPVLADRAPFTFLTPGDTAARAFTPAALTRLRTIKHSRDPYAIIRSNYPVLA